MDASSACSWSLTVLQSLHLSLAAPPTAYPPAADLGGLEGEVTPALQAHGMANTNAWMQFPP